MAVDIWLPRLKIANVGRASPEKIIKHFLEQVPWEISNSKNWKNNENGNKTLHLPYCADTALFVKSYLYLSSHGFGSFRFVSICLDTARTSRLSSNTPGARYCLCCRRYKFLWYNLRHRILWEIGNVMLSSLLSLYQGGKLAFWQGQDHQIANKRE